MEPIRIGMLGSGSIARTHADALKQVPQAKITHVYSRNMRNAEMFAKWKGIDNFTDDHRAVIEADLDLVLICLPNDLHAPMAVLALTAGKHVIVEKPLALSLEQAASIAAAADQSGKQVFYAEELPFIPKFSRVKELIAEGAVGKVYMVRQIEKHAGPYSPWFFSREEAGGGALMDMGCHGVELIRWLLGDRDPVSVLALIDTFVHHDKTDLDDHAVINMRFADGVIGISESSWCLQGGMESVLEVQGTTGNIYADLGKGSGVTVYSNEGFGMVADQTRGWTKPIYEHDREWGYVGELTHFMECLRSGKTPIEGLSQGKSVLSILLAAYQSAGTGKTVRMPFEPQGVVAPVDLWKNPLAG